MKKSWYSLIIAYIAIFLLNHSVSTFAIDDKGLIRVKVEPEKKTTVSTLQLSLNKAEDFQNNIAQDTYVFLVGNNNYTPSSGFTALEFCINDVYLLKSILINCCRIKAENIVLYQDLAAWEFGKYFQEFINRLHKGDRVIIYYSGHGLKDGSLVFIDGKALEPGDLRDKINTFFNDTVLILDACYSGSNDGPADIVIRHPFRFNCQRIYASLAHQTAKEIAYEKNPYFNAMLPFFNDVLYLTGIKGNSYFMAMIALFFASYKFGAGENVTFNDIVNFVTSRCKEYVEILSRKGAQDTEAAHEAQMRSYQLPKIEPWEKELQFVADSNKYIVYRHRIDQFKLMENYFSLNWDIKLPLMTLNEDFCTGLASSLTFAYHIVADWGILGLGAGIDVSYVINRKNAIPYDLWINPITLGAEYTTNFMLPLYLYLKLYVGGVFFNFMYNDENLPDQSPFTFYINSTIGLGWFFSKQFAVNLYCHYSAALFQEGLLGWITPGIGTSFNF